MARSRTYIATPPGATIKEQLKDRGMSQKEFAARMDMSEKHISKLVNGDVQLTQDVAVRLETVLGVPASFWNNLEAIYREKLVKADAENKIDSDIEIAKKFPYAEMASLGWIPATKVAKEKVFNLRKYFGVVELSLLGNEQITHIACRRLAVTEKADLALMAWSQQAKIEARDIEVSPIDVKKLTDTIPEIRKLTTRSPEEFCDILRQYMADCGVALVFLPHLKGSYLQGATFVDGKKIVMGLTVRGKDADKFWFSLFHEIAHIVLGHISETDGISDEEEKDADEWAKSALIDQDKFRYFSKNEVFSEQKITEFAEEQGIAPGIVVGLMQMEGLIRYNMHNKLKVKYEIE